MRSPVRYLLRLDRDLVSFRRRSFRLGSVATAPANIEAIGEAFLDGYHAALAASDLEALPDVLDRAAAEELGFRFEGAAMGLYLLDRLGLFNHGRFQRLLALAPAHVYMMHVGAGWGIARLPFGFTASLRRLDPLLRWLAMDGYGFHDGFFHWPRTIQGRHAVPKRIKGYARRAYDQGLGRSLWFVEGHDVERIAVTVSSFAEQRRDDLWAGVGLAATYACGVSNADLALLLELAGRHRFALAQGAVFAAEARLRAGNVVADTERACRVLCGRNAKQAAMLARSMREALPADLPEMPAYEVWRSRIQACFRVDAGQSSPRSPHTMVECVS